MAVGTGGYPVSFMDACTESWCTMPKKNDSTLLAEYAAEYQRVAGDDALLYVANPGDGLKVVFADGVQLSTYKAGLRHMRGLLAELYGKVALYTPPFTVEKEHIEALRFYRKINLDTVDHHIDVSPTVRAELDGVGWTRSYDRYKPLTDRGLIALQRVDKLLGR